jgi:hypothetical protein
MAEGTTLRGTACLLTPDHARAPVPARRTLVLAAACWALGSLAASASGFLRSPIDGVPSPYAAILSSLASNAPRVPKATSVATYGGSIVGSVEGLAGELPPGAVNCASR